mmetsp:Transcript_19197/g.33830  ORF Transcript_19197/g.33830 Transcript_19197/m.33830 type:complete len:224 (-) Transcript_19197:650-1321(-)
MDGRAELVRDDGHEAHLLLFQSLVLGNVLSNTHYASDLAEGIQTRSGVQQQNNLSSTTATRRETVEAELEVCCLPTGQGLVEDSLDTLPGALLHAVVGHPILEIPSDCFIPGHARYLAHHLVPLGNRQGLIDSEDGCIGRVDDSGKILRGCLCFLLLHLQLSDVLPNTNHANDLSIRTTTRRSAHENLNPAIPVLCEERELKVGSLHSPQCHEKHLPNTVVIL